MDCRRKTMAFMAAVVILISRLNATSGHDSQEAAAAAEEADRIVSLPGQPKVPFRQFSGYVTVHEAAGRALFYWLTEAYSDPSSKPLVVWLNGGPGCSSVAYGASEEIGPFRINKTASGLYLNKFSWNTEANLLFLETPAGVGFSYSNRSSDLLDTGDRRTAEDSLEFLVRWMERFPSYKGREVFLTGESYAGHYVPQLARQIMAHNLKPKHSTINLRGIMVGNAVTDNYYDNMGTVTYWWSHAMISDQTYKQLMSTCDFRRQKESNECESVYSYAMDQEFGNIDQYNIYAPPCNSSDGSSAAAAATRQSIRLPHRPHHNKILRQISGYDPCTEKYAETYYNRPDVQRALHANTTKIPYKWTACSELLNRNWNDTEVSILPIYREMIAGGLRVWVFSGDVDSVVPVTATRYSLAQLKLATKIPWYPWYVKKQVSAVIWSGLSDSGRLWTLGSQGSCRSRWRDDPSTSANTQKQQNTKTAHQFIGLRIKTQERDHPVLNFPPLTQLLAWHRRWCSEMLLQLLQAIAFDFGIRYPRKKDSRTQPPSSKFSAFNAASCLPSKMVLRNVAATAASNRL